MDKIAGKFGFFIIILLCSITNHAQVMLRLQSTKGKPISEIEMGQPFVIDVSVDDSQQPEKLSIQGIEKFQQFGRQTNMRIVNNHKSIRYMYTVATEKPGTYTIGPAELVIGGNTLTSPTASITVTKPSATNASAVQTKDDSLKIFARLSVDKQRAVVGENIQCKVEVFMLDNSVALQKINEPEVTGCVLESPIDKGTTTRTINGNKYTCREFLWNLALTQAGEVTVPAFRVNYQIMEDEEDDTDGNPIHAYLTFWGMKQTNVQSKRLYTNECTLKVDALPESDEPIAGIGHFTKFSAHAKPTVVKEGDGIVLTLELEGDGNLPRIETPQLQELPSEFKWYDSKQYLVGPEQNNGVPKKCFEYIIQGMKTGEWEIPKQKFVYFDTQTRKCKTLKSSSIRITIVPATTNKLSTQAQKNETNQKVTATALDITDNISPINKEGWYPRHERALPLWLFVIFMLIPVLFWLFIFTKISQLTRSILRVSRRKKQQAFIHARKSLQYAQQRNEYRKLYAIFIELFAERFALPPAMISEDLIEQRLRQAGVSDVHMKEWHLFFSAIAALVFADTATQYMAPPILFRRAQQWLDYFESKV
ncbi:MAG TPA: BatD family protein [Candidatus Babeliales bacterium]|nr:BatD family protein [Candidatus Babeliales bacterium]